jgi:hypothetical protein
MLDSDSETDSNSVGLEQIEDELQNELEERDRSLEEQDHSVEDARADSATADEDDVRRSLAIAPTKF